MLKRSIIVATLLGTTFAVAETVPITGTVESRCSIYTDTAGVYGNSVPSTLTTQPGVGGVEPVVRFDVVLANSYKAKIAYPESFTTSPNLTDSLNWTGDVTVSKVSDPQMSDYDTTKITYNNVHEYDLTVAGSTWFSVKSTVDYGVNKSFPGGSYTALVTAECIAK